MTGVEWEQVAAACVAAIEHERSEWRKLLEQIHKLEPLVLGVDIAQVRRDAGLRQEEE